MKKILTVLLATASLAAFAEDSYLYWMVGYTDPFNDYTAVKVKGVTSADSGYLTLYAPDGSTPLGERVSYADIQTLKTNGDAGLYAQLASGTTYSSFIVELINEQGFVAQSQMSYSDVAQYIVRAGDMTMPTTQMWAASSFAVPEPNSALLLMIGCAALGLRRRKARLV